ncbi:MAG: aminotransferase class I/II-fold pyridoxal phosphate-dependent enzyme [bacterium]|nr:aminotransferase class I/II-fold pyridoxal phosphate-dependent enzyme [bacterium]
MSFDPSRYLNPAIAAVPKSGIRKFFDMAATMPGAISLGVGEPDFVTPYHIRDAAINSLLDGETQYTSNWGLLSLRQEIAQYMEGRFQLRYDPQNEILVTVGASEGIDLSLRAILCPGDEVLIPEPSYVSYAPGVVFAGGTPVPMPTCEENAFALTPEAVEAAVTPRTKAIILPYPNNPTGAVLTREQTAKLAEVFIRHDLIVISDEIYAELCYIPEGHVSIAAMPGMRERTFVLNGFSKAFAMTGWRMGFICAPAAFCDVMCKIHQYTILCAPRQGQVAAEQALKRGREDNYADVRRMRESYDQRRRLMVKSFREMGLSCFEPLGAFYVFPGIQKTGLTSEGFCERLLREHKVVCVPGTAFGASGEGYIRCSYATGLKQLEEALSRMAAFVKSL